MGRKCPKREFPLWKPSCVALYRGAWAVSRVRSCFFLPIQPQWCPWRPGSGCRRANRRADINVSAAISIGLTRSVRRSCRSCAEPGAARRGRRGASSAPGAPHPLLPRRAPPHLLHRRSTRLCQQSHGRSTVRLIGERSERQGEQRGGRCANVSAGRQAFAYPLPLAAASALWPAVAGSLQPDAAGRGGAPPRQQPAINAFDEPRAARWRSARGQRGARASVAPQPRPYSAAARAVLLSLTRRLCLQPDPAIKSGQRAPFTPSHGARSWEAAPPFLNTIRTRPLLGPWPDAACKRGRR